MTFAPTQAAFAVLLAALLGYVMLRRRRVDLFTIAAAGAFLYFLPALVGEVRIWVADGRVTDRLPLTAFLVMSLVVVTLLTASSAFDRIRLGYREEASPRHPSRPAALALLGLAYLSFTMFVLDYGPSIVVATKAEIYGDRNTTLYNFALYPAMCMLVYGTAVRSRALVIGSAFLLLLDSFLVMNRTFLVLGAASAGLLHLNRLGPVRLIRLWKWIAVGIIFTWGMMAYHHVKEPIKNLEFARAFDRVTQPGYIAYAVLSSEPFSSQGVLSEVVRQDFRVPMGEYTASWFVGIPLWGAALGQPPRFSAQFQPALFPGVGQTGVMAENYWAQGWAVGGWLGVGLHLFAYLLGIAVFSRGTTARNPLVSSASAVIGVWIAFYIHRNDVFGMVISIRRIAGVFILIWVATLVLKATVPGRRHAAVESR